MERYQSRFGAEDQAWFNAQVPYTPANRERLNKRLMDAIQTTTPIEQAYEQQIDAERKMTAYWRKKYEEEKSKPDIPIVKTILAVSAIFAAIYVAIGFGIWRCFHP